MTDHDDNDDNDDKRTEGVRIIGAQEAAEAAGRPDVVRRRRRSEKRFGDRPDRPEPASDLPKITISTTESDESRGEGMGSVPLVRPGSAGPEPDWAEDSSVYGPTDDSGERINVGHARIVPAESPDEVVSDVEMTYSSGSDLGDWSEDDATQTWDESPAIDSRYSPAAQSEELNSDDVYSDDIYGESAGDTYGAGGAEYSEDDSFVLPHWTEPPTGQVPKVVIGDSGGDPTGSVDYVSQPRWRGEGERSSATDFGDLLDDGPRLGALGGDDDYAEDDFFAPESFSSDSTDGEYDEYEDEYDEEAQFDDNDRPKSRAERRGGADSDAGSGGADRSLGIAALVGVGLVALGLACFKLGALPTALLVTAVLTYAAVEFFTAVRDAGFNTANLLGVPAVAGLVFATYSSGLEAYPAVIGLTIITGLLWYLWIAPGERAVANLGVTLLGVLWIGFLGSFATLFLGIGRDLMTLDPSLKSNPGIGVLIAAVVVAVSHDVGAYFVGRQFGSTPLSAASPNKTQEGLIGGVLTAIVATVVIVGVFQINPIGESLARTVIFAVLCSLAAPLGDLCESAIKRDLKVKDMGAILPGHGGVLDRFDALLFVLPTAYFLSTLLGVWTLTP